MNIEQKIADEAAQQGALHQIKTLCEYDARERGQWRLITEQIVKICDLALSQLPTPATASEQEAITDADNLRAIAERNGLRITDDVELVWREYLSQRPTPSGCGERWTEKASRRLIEWIGGVIAESGSFDWHDIDLILREELAATPSGGGKVGSALDMLCQAEDCTELATGFQKLASQAVKLLRHVGKSRDEHNAAIIQSAIEKATAVKDEALVNYWRELQKVRDHWSGLLEKERAKTSGGAKSKNETKT